MAISLTYLKRERFVADRLLDNIDYATKNEAPELELEVFEGKPFKYLTPEQLIKQVGAISTKFKNSELINDFFIRDHEEVSSELVIGFDLNGKKSALEGYKEKLNIEIGRIELQDKVKKKNYCGLDPDTKTFYFTLPNGSVQHLALYTERSISENLFRTFKVLYEHWLEFSDKTITKSEMLAKLKKVGWEDVDDYKIKHTINNLRDTKIKPARLSNYIQIVGDRKGKGYKLIITYP